MCFGGGGGRQQAPAPINIMPQAPIVKTPEPPKQLAQDYKPLQPRRISLACSKLVVPVAAVIKLLVKATWLAVVVCLLVSLVLRQLLLLEALTCEERTCSV